MSVVASLIVPGMPHPLLVPAANPAYTRLRAAYDEARRRIQELQPDLLLLYSTQWPSVIGHQVQARASPSWVHVDQEWHELGSIPYTFRMDAAFGQEFVEAGRVRGLEMRTVDYEGFPIDTGSIVALKLLDPDNDVPASIVSCNMYADRAETIVLGKAAADAVDAHRVPDAEAEGGWRPARVVAIAVTALSHRVHTAPIPFAEDRIHSQKDDEWNRKYLEILGAGRLEDAAQLARTFSAQAGGDQKMKAIWWLNALNGQHNAFSGDVVAYEAVYGTGAAIVALMPTARETGQAEFDEDDTEVHLGDRNVLGGASLFESADGVEAARGTGSRRSQDVSRDPDAITTAPMTADADGVGGNRDDPGAADASAASTRAMDAPAAGASTADVTAAAGAPAQDATVQGADDIVRMPAANAMRPGTRARPPAGARAHGAHLREAADAGGAATAGLGASGQGTGPGRTPAATPGDAVHATGAPRPVGAYPHARRVGDMLYLSGLGPRDPASDEVPGGPVWDKQGRKQDYDVRAQTEAVVRNMKAVLATAGATIDDVVDVTCYLIDMQRDFAGFNEVYAKHFGDVQAARTTIEINRLPTPIAVEFKVIAKAPSGGLARRHGAGSA